MVSVSDDLGAEMELADDVTRIVSLVPSLTEAIAATRPHALVGATDWCTRPAELEVARVRGTKNPDLGAIGLLSPHLVLANKEENRRSDVARLRSSGIPVWVTDIASVDAALASLRRLFEVALRWPVPQWLTAAEGAWAAPALPTATRVAIAIWRDPWMVVGSPTFAGDLVARAGLVNVFADWGGRYARVSIADIRAARPDVVLLPDEPYVFTADDGPEAFPGVRCALISGRALTWYGPALLEARHAIETALRW